MKEPRERDPIAIDIWREERETKRRMNVIFGP